MSIVLKVLLLLGLVAPTPLKVKSDLAGTVESATEPSLKSPIFGPLINYDEMHDLITQFVRSSQTCPPGILRFLRGHHRDIPSGTRLGEFLQMHAC